MNRICLSVFVAVFAVGCSSDLPYSDAMDALPSEDARAAPTLGPWSSVRRMAELNTPHNDWAPSFRDDLREIYFVTERAGQADLYVANRDAVDQRWGEPRLAAALNGDVGEWSPCLSRDGLTMWFASARSGGQGSWDIWEATRTTRASAWVISGLVVELNSIGEDHPKYVDATNRKMYFVSTRPGTLGYDSFDAARDDHGAMWTTISALADLSSPAQDAIQHVSDDELRAFITSNRAGADGSFDFYVAERNGAADRFGPPTPVAELNTPFDEVHAWLSSDERTIVFSSNRDGLGFDLYTASRE